MSDKPMKVPPGMWDYAKTACRLGIAESTLKHWKKKGEAPAHFKVGHRVYFKPEDVEKFFEAQRVEAGTDTGPEGTK